MEAEAGIGFTARVQAHTSSLTSSVTLWLCCLINEMVLTTTSCVNQNRPTVLTNNPPNRSGLNTHFLPPVECLGGKESCAPYNHSRTQALL